MADTTPPPDTRTDIQKLGDALLDAARKARDIALDALRAGTPGTLPPPPKAKCTVLVYDAAGNPWTATATIARQADGSYVVIDAE